MKIQITNNITGEVEIIEVPDENSTDNETVL